MTRGKWVITANYTSGDVGVLAIGSDGTLGAPSSLHVGNMAHQAFVDPTDHYAWVPCLGSDYVAQFTFDVTSGALSAQTPPTVTTPTKAGPRHMALHPTKAFAYVGEETDSMIGAYTVESGKLTLLKRQSTRAAGATGTNTSAEVAVHPNGNFVYVSNRGDDDIGVFSIGPDGNLTPIDHTKTGGTVPRQFSIDPTGHWLIVANMKSGDVHVFKIGSDGKLTATGTPLTITSPEFVGIVAL